MRFTLPNLFFADARSSSGRRIHDPILPLRTAKEHPLNHPTAPRPALPVKATDMEQEEHACPALRRAQERARSVLPLFLNVTVGDPTEPDAHFENASLDSVWGRSLVFDLNGESVPLPGPIHVEDRSKIGGRRKKMRLVEVKFFFYTRSGNYTADGPESRLFARAYGWQGDNNLIHLLEHMSLLDDDPMGSAVSDPIEARAGRSLEDRLRTHRDGRLRGTHTVDDLDAMLKQHAERLEATISAEEERIHQINYGMDEPQDTMT